MSFSNVQLQKRKKVNVPDDLVKLYISEVELTG